MDTSDSSDDEKDMPGSKSSKLKIVDVDEHVSDDEKEEAPAPSLAKPKPKRTKTSKRSRTQRSERRKTTNTSGRTRKRAEPTGLNGNYWNVIQPERQATRTRLDQSQFDENDDDETTSLSEVAAQERLEPLLITSSSSSDSPDEQRPLLYANRTFVTCRSPEDAFFLCRVLQDVYNDTKQIRIRWCSLVDEKGDETKVDENTRFKLDYEDTLDPLTILTGIPNVVHHPDRSLSLRKQDIIETRRLLEKSIKGETISSDEPMDLTTENNEHSTPEVKKIRTSSDSSRRSSAKKRVRLGSGEAAPIKKRRRTKDLAEIELTTAPKTIPKKIPAKSVAASKAQLFKVHSNRFLKENSAITIYRSEPFFEDSQPVPFISSSVQGKLAIRAVLLNDPNLLKSLIDDVDRVCSVHLKRDYRNELSAIHYAIKNDNIECLRILLDDLKTPKKNRCPYPEVTMPTQSTGNASIRTLGFRTAPIMASRGAREGNNALNKDSNEPLTNDETNDIFDYALKINCSPEVFDFLLLTFPDDRDHVNEHVSQSIRAGHRRLASTIIGEMKDSFHGFNALHHQVLLYDNEDLVVKYPSSVVKKSRDNFQITPIHCAAINPNSKYLKQLLSIVPEYNILDKYERRPIHFAAACEGPEPLEYLLSRHVNFNDTDRGGNSPLHLAATYGRAINAEILLRTAKEKAESNEVDDQIVHQKFGLASINRMNKARFYPLHLAVMNNHLECVKVLLEFGANIDVPTNTTSGKMTPLMFACERGNFKLVIHLIERGAKVEARDRFKRTPLIHACMCGNAHIVSHLLRLGANPNVVDSSMNTALHYTIAYGWYFPVRLLIEAGANLNCVNSWQTTCLAAGFSKGHFGLCDYLLTEHHIDINFQTDEGLTLVMLTTQLKISNSSVQQLEYVVEKHKANCTTVDVNGRNAFHYLASNTTSEIVVRKNVFRLAEILLNHHCNPNQLDNKSQTPLMIALQTGNFVLVDFFLHQVKLEITADVSSDGKTLLHYFAMQSNDENLIEMLLKMPVNDQWKKMGKMTDDEGRTPFHYSLMKFDAVCRQNDRLKSEVKMIKFLLETIGCDPDIEVDQPNIFFLLRTSLSSSSSSVEHPLEIFLKKTKDVNVRHPQTERTALLEAIYLKEFSTSQFLLQQTSCDVNLSLKNGKTPLIVACELQFYSIIRQLLKHPRCDFSARDEEQNQAFHYFLNTSKRSNEFLETFQLFLEKFNSMGTTLLNSRNKRGRTPLHIAVYQNSGAIDVVNDVEQSLINYKCDLFVQDDQGNLPLHNVFLNIAVHSDPVDLCILLSEAMGMKSLDTKNNQGNTPFHLAVKQCSSVCVLFFQEHHADFYSENHLANSIIGTCIYQGHLNLLITFLHQSIDIDLGKVFTVAKEKSSDEFWLWKFANSPEAKSFDQFSLIDLILRHDWPGPLSLIMKKLDHFHLKFLHVFESAVTNKKYNFILHLLPRYKDRSILNSKNPHGENVFHFLAKAKDFDENLMKQIFNFLHDHHVDWNFADKNGSFPLHYACVEQNFTLIEFFREKYPLELNLNQIDAFGNTAFGLLFWSLARAREWNQSALRSLISSSKSLDCLCNYENEISINPLSFGHFIGERSTYPGSKTVRTSPLINAVVHRNFELAKFLLQLGVDVNFTDEEKQTPLMHAVRANQLNMVKLLLNKDFDPNAPIEQVVEKRRPKTSRFFLGMTTNEVEEEMIEDFSPRFRITSSIDLNASDGLGRTSIHHLVQPFPDGSYTMNIDLLELLHSSGASLIKSDLVGLTPLQYGVINGCQHLCDALIRLTHTHTHTRATVEPFQINDPNEKLLEPTDFYSDAQNFIDQNFISRPIETLRVDRLSQMTKTGEVLIDNEKNEPFDVRLTRIDVDYGYLGFYNFYRMQIIKHKSKTNHFLLFTRWGRIGAGDGQYQLTPFSNLDECRKEFQKVFREKTGNLWKDTEQFQLKPKKYSLVQLNEREMKKFSDVPIDFDLLRDEKRQNPSKLQSTIYKSFFQTLMNPQAIRSNLNKTRLDIEWMPVSQLKKQNLNKAREILHKLKSNVKRKDQLKLEIQQAKNLEGKNELKILLETIHQLTNDYYTLIPFQGFADEKLPILDENSRLEDQERILNDIVELDLSYKMFLAAQVNFDQISPYDYLYKSINCRFEAMNKDDIDSQLILRYIWTSAANVKVEQIFKVARPNEDQRLSQLNIDNHQLLWHGTNICNLISILTRGLLVAPLVAQRTGVLYGKGIYTADTFTKSLAYCTGVEQDGSERCFMLLCEVALGNISEIGDENENDDCGKPLDTTKFHSRKAIGQNIPDPRFTITRNYGVRMPLGPVIPNSNLKFRHRRPQYNEYIVYNEAQVALRYLVQFRR